MADTFVEEVANPRPTPGTALLRAPEEEVAIEGNGRIAPLSGGGVADDAVVDGGRLIPDSVKEKIAAIVKGQKPVAADPDEPAETGADEEDKDDPDAPPGEPKPADVEAKPETKAETPAEPDPVAQLRSEIARRDEANARLLAELESTKKQPAPSTGFVPKADYLDDSLANLREYLAHQLGVATDSKEVDTELALLYTDLTAKELGVTPDATAQATREAARARQLWAREKRQRTADKQEVPKVSDETEKATQAAAFIGNRLTTIKATERYPLLTSLSEDLHGQKPEVLLWRVIQSGIQTGRLDAKSDDDALIDAAAKEIETRYQALIAKANQAIPKPKPSTEPPNGLKPSAAATSASKDAGQSHGARTLTAADASVAPATPPAKKPKPKTDEPPKFKNDDERRDWALRHLRKKS